MAHALKHAQSSARKFGGRAEDYLPIHNWFDESKAFLADFRHRALRHHAEGIFLTEKLFGVAIANSDGKTSSSPLCRRAARQRRLGPNSHGTRLALADQAATLDVRPLCRSRDSVRYAEILTMPRGPLRVGIAVTAPAHMTPPSARYAEVVIGIHSA